MMNWLWGKKETKAPNTEQGIETLGKAADTIEKREALLQKRIDQEVLKAREASKKGNKTLALSHLKKKKILEDQMTKLQAQRANVEGMQMKLEEVALNVETAKAQQEGAKSIKQAYGKMTPDKIDAEMEKVREVMDQASEISDALAQPLCNDPVDEDELEAELAAMDQEELDKDMLGLDAKTAMPTVPSGQIGTPAQKQPAKQTSEEEEALRELEAELNMG